MSTAIQSFLRGDAAHDGLIPAQGANTEAKLAFLEERYAITAKRHPRYPNLVHFKYNQIESPFAEQIVRECRGIILDAADNWRIVSRAFDKFFNYGEGHAAQIDWSTARVQEKVDGSLCVVYPYAGEWHVATTGTPDGGGQVNGAGRTFAEYFWDTIEAYGNPFVNMAPYKHYRCFFFELCGPDNRVVVPHGEPHLWVLGSCYLLPNGTTEEWPAEPTAAALNARAIQPRVPLKPVRTFGLQSFDDIAKSFETMSPLSQEGYVVCDANFNRVKVKHPGYVALHHAKDGMTEKAFIEICRKGETCEVLTAFPEFRPLMEKVQAKLDAYVAEIEADYQRIQHIPVQKDFALEAVKTRNPAALFQVRAGKARDVRHYVAEMRIDNLKEALQ